MDEFAYQFRLYFKKTRGSKEQYFDFDYIQKGQGNPFVHGVMDEGVTQLIKALEGVYRVYYFMRTKEGKRENVFEMLGTTYEAYCVMKGETKEMRIRAKMFEINQKRFIQKSCPDYQKRLSAREKEEHDMMLSCEQSGLEEALAIISPAYYSYKRKRELDFEKKYANDKVYNPYKVSYEVPKNKR